MGKKRRFALFLSLLLVLGSVPAAAFAEGSAAAYTDIEQGSYYYDAVLWASSNGIAKGSITPGLFQPQEPCTRAQIVTFLWRSAGSPVFAEITANGLATNACPFADVSKEYYYYDAVVWAAKKGIARGTLDGLFHPDMICSRSQVAAMLARYCGRLEEDCQTGFADVPENAYYASSVAWMVELGIAKGTSASTFSPAEACTRGQVVTFLYRMMKG